jgi:hypothetical protein
MFDLNSHVKTLLNEYIEKFPNEIDRFELLKDQLDNNDHLSSRKNFK